MTAIDRILANALLLDDPHVPEDIVPQAYTPGPAPDGLPLREDVGLDLADHDAAASLRALCEVVVARSTPDQLIQFVTDQIPEPRSAWILACHLTLARHETGARFWWQYAAGAGEPAASFCLHLHHLAAGDRHAAALYYAQANDDSHSTGLPSLDNSIPTYLRILRHLAPADDRRRDETTRALTSYVSAAVAAGYARHPDIEIPLPGPYFAEWVTIILAADGSLPNPVQPHAPAPAKDTAAALPARPADDRCDTQHQPDPGSVLLLEAAVADEETATAIRHGLTACWATVTAQRTPGQSGRRTRLLRYLLDRHPQSPSRLLETAGRW